MIDITIDAMTAVVKLAMVKFSIFQATKYTNKPFITSENIPNVSTLIGSVINVTTGFTIK
jgi:hypothetical protein